MERYLTPLGTGRAQLTYRIMKWIPWPQPSGRHESLTDLLVLSSTMLVSIPENSLG